MVWRAVLGKGGFSDLCVCRMEEEFEREFWRSKERFGLSVFRIGGRVGCWGGCCCCLDWVRLAWMFVMYFLFFWGDFRIA